MASFVGGAIRSTVVMGVKAIAGFNRKRLPKVVDHPYLTAVHTPMTEERSLTDLAVTGTIPTALDGRYLRIGPNPVAANPASYHWFIGDGMVHGLRIQDGRALWYKNRWIRSRQVAQLLGGSAAPGPRNRSGDTVNTNVTGIAGRIHALVEAGSFPVVLSDDLETQAYDAFGDTLHDSFTAHPHLDPLSGEQHAICYNATAPEIIRHVVINREGQVIREEPIPVKHGPSIHDCALTARYVLVLDLPVTFSKKTFLAGHDFPYAWNLEHRARVGLMPRHGTADDVIWCDVDPAYVFHPCNAYDLPDGRVVMDVVAYATMFDESTQGPDNFRGAFERWTIDPAAFGFSALSADDLAGGDPADNATIVRAVLGGSGSAAAQAAVTLNAAAALYVHRDGGDYAAMVREVQAALANQSALRVLDQLVTASATG
jgi:carotenoid cleavage dioxygenase